MREMEWELPFPLAFAGRLQECGGLRGGSDTDISALQTDVKTRQQIKETQQETVMLHSQNKCRISASSSQVSLNC